MALAAAGPCAPASKVQNESAPRQNITRISFLEPRDLQGIMNPVSNLDARVTSMFYNYVASWSPESGRRAWLLGVDLNRAMLPAHLSPTSRQFGTSRFFKPPATDVCVAPCTRPHTVDDLQELVFCPEDPRKSTTPYVLLWMFTTKHES